MASVPLEFALPAEEGLTALKIYEATDPVAGPWTLIDTVAEIGSYPEYIHEYITNNAVSATDWFAISYVDEAQVESDLSVPMQGGTQTLVNIIVERVLQRGTSLSQSIVTQEAEAVIEQYFNFDPYLVDASEVSYRVMTGLTYLVLARISISQISTTSGSAVSWTAGLVSMKSADQQQTKVSIDWLVSEAQKLLGLGYSVVAQMAIPEIARDLASFVTEFDISRLEVTSVE